MIRNAIMHALRETVKHPVHSLPINFIYEHPSIAALASFVYQWATTGSASETGRDSERALKVAEMEQLLGHFTRVLNERFPDIQQAPPINGFGHAPGEEVVVITGTTGYLGSFLLEQTIRDPRVRKVFALNRYSSASGVAIIERQRDAFRSMSIDPALLNDPKVEFLAADYPRQRLGLADRSGSAVLHALERSGQPCGLLQWHTEYQQVGWAARNSGPL